MEIREIGNDEMQDAMSLVLEVFMEFEAPDYGEEGINTFKSTGIENQEFVAALKTYGAFDNGIMTGIISMRNKGSHIGLFFVKREYQGRGIGRALFQEAISKSCAESITVNSSPYAEEIYHRFGFVNTDTMQTIGGVRFIPMKLDRYSALN